MLAEFRLHGLKTTGEAPPLFLVREKPRGEASVTVRAADSQKTAVDVDPTSDRLDRDYPVGSE